VPVKFIRAVLLRSVSILAGSNANLVRVTYRFVITIKKMVKTHGETLTVKWLKACHVATMRYIGQDSVDSLRDIEPDLPMMRTASGLPAIIPVTHRRAIRAYKHNNLATGGILYVRLWLTLFGLYRVLSIPGVMKLSTISDLPTFDSSWLDMLKFLPVYSEWLERRSPSYKR